MVHDLFDDDVFETLARILSPPPEIILDIGAHIGSSSDRILEVFPVSRIMAFEPVAATFDRLVQRCSEDPRIEAHRFAVGNLNDELQIRVNGFADTSSALAPTDECLRYHGDKVRELRRERVEMIRLDDWADRRDSVGAIEAMKIDVQGLELEVLRGAEGLLRSTVKAVICEAEMAPIYHGAATFSEIDLFFRDCGFVLHQVCRIASAGLEQRTTCCDALWVRADVHRSFVARITDRAGVTSGAQG